MAEYIQSPTGHAFHESDAFVKLIMGPYASGKSTICATDILSYACSQHPAADGVRYTRVGVIRKLKSQVKTAVGRSIRSVFPKQYGYVNNSGSPVSAFYYFPLPDGTKVHCELDIWALENEDDAIKIKSSNWTFAWLNEADELDHAVFTQTLSRIQRYPDEDVAPRTWGGVLLDFNKPAKGSWLDDLINNVPDNYKLFVQPPAAFMCVDEDGNNVYEINENAENIRNVGAYQEGDPTEFSSPEDYDDYLVQRGKRFYSNQIRLELLVGREDKVQNLFCLMDVPIIDGKPVYANSFDSGRHVATNEIKPISNADIIIGVDQSGINPAAVIIQSISGRWCVIDEMLTPGEGLENFIYGVLIPALRTKYPSNPVTCILDPSNTRDSWGAITPKDRFEQAGLFALANVSNAIRVRLQAVEELLNKHTGGLYISPTCTNLIDGFKFGYKFKALNTRGSVGKSYSPVPDKNEYSHFHDALQYAVLHIISKNNYNTYDITKLSEVVSNQRRILSRVV